MPDLPSTRLDSLHLRNFRRFADLRLELHPELTVLVAENGGGKTALLDAIAIALRPLVDGLRMVKPRGFGQSDVRRVRAPTGAMVSMWPLEVDAEALIDGTTAQWHRELPRFGTSEKIEDCALTALARKLRSGLESYAEGHIPTPPLLPIVAYYGTARLWRQRGAAGPAGGPPVDQTEQTDAYRGSLATRTSFVQVGTWLEQVAREAQNEQASGVRSPHHATELLSAVRRATDIVLQPSGWARIDWDFLAHTLVAEHSDQGRLPVGLLSDGVRSLLALVVDLAHRAVRLNPHLGRNACEESRGIVLIDEVDIHLHPSWQQTVLSLLRQAFPHLQFIVTTHSHLVVSTVPSQCIRILEPDGTVTTPDVQVQGAESPYALSVVFGVDSSPPLDVVHKLAKLRSLIEQGLGDSRDAHQLRTQVAAHFGPEHPAMLGLAGLERFQRFKAGRAHGGGRP